ncbi:ribonuclease H-like domain-containing protein [Tanacetum coccineum]
MKLMQFLMGVDDSYMQIRSYILSREVLLNVRSAYATIFSEESHRVVSASVSSSSQRNQIMGYPADFRKKKSGQNSKGKNISNNNAVRSSSSFGFTNEQIATLISLIKDNKVGKNVQANMAVLFDVLVILEYCVTLIFVHKLAKDNKIFVAFDESRCYFLNLKKVLRIGNQCGGLYYFSDQAKQTREPFPLSDHTSSKLGDLVHLDLWGPYKVNSFEGFRYFFTVVDDYTRAVWVYLIKSKDEVAFYTSNFCNLIENQFKSNIKVFRSDNGGIPLKMWTECILTATYLINRLPSSVLNEKSPYEMIYKKPPTLSHLRVFGCLCFATIVNNHDKLGSRYEKCVMMGYFSYKKGYRLYSLDRHQFIFSRDVKFFESVFPFKDSVSKEIDTSIFFQDLNHIKFSDNEYPEMPYDDERVDPKLNSDQRLQSNNSHSSVPVSCLQDAQAESTRKTLAFSESAKKQQSVAKSLAEDEYVAAAGWDHILKGDIELHFIPTKYQLADIFTKPLDEPTFTRLKAELGMLNINLSVSLIKRV